MARVVSYFSCGDASAVATKLALASPLPEGCDEGEFDLLEWAQVA